VSQDLLVRAAGFFQGVRKNGEAVWIEGAGRQLALVVGGLGEVANEAVVPAEPGGIEGSGTKRIPEDAASCSRASWPSA
jgi:hypothetical protein